MLIRRDCLHTAYRRRLYAAASSSASSSSPLLLFVAADADAVAACHIVTSLLRTDHIPYKVTPVSSYDDLHKANLALHKDVAADIRVIILINCGATVDLVRFFHLPDHCAITYFVIDSHRPYHLANVDPGNANVVILDGSIEEEEFPSDVDVSSSEEDSDESGTEQRLSEKQHRIAQYYHGSFFGTSSATVCFTLATQLQKNDSNLLWCGIVGLTDQFVHRRISRAKYQAEVDLYMHEVFKTDSGEADAESSTRSTSADANSPEQYEDQVVMASDGRVSFERDEFTFFLFRHWTLFEAMFHARSVATRLRVWRESGRRHLQMMLAKLGIPLKESNASYCFMENECKTRLRKHLSSFAGEYGLDDDELFFPSFTRQYGNDMVLSAADAVYVVCGLLETASSADTDADVDTSGNFWMAHDSLQSRDLSLVRKGLRLSIELQKEVVNIGHSLLAKRQIVSTGMYRLCIMENPGRSSMFREPLALNKLAFFLIEAHEETLLVSKKRQRSGHSRKPKVMPFVLCVLLEERHSYLVLGIPREASQRDVLRNHFSTGFAEAALQTNARVKHDGFESSVIEVQKDDLRQFLDILVTQLQHRW